MCCGECGTRMRVSVRSRVSQNRAPGSKSARVRGSALPAMSLAGRSLPSSLGRQGKSRDRKCMHVDAALRQFSGLHGRGRQRPAAANDSRPAFFLFSVALPLVGSTQ